jgi:hypothetical protein
MAIIFFVDSCQIVKTLLHLVIVEQIRIPAGIAQLVEQRTENPRVTGSSPVPGIFHTTPDS